MTVRNRIRAGDGDPRHGTCNGYVNHKCRCEPCRAAWASYCARRREERQLAPDDPRHGRWTTYLNYKCRCDACMEAHNCYERQLYQDRKARVDA